MRRSRFFLQKRPLRSPALYRRVAALSVTEIVSPEDLLHALAVETPLVANRLQKLLLPSYFPNAEEGPSLVAYLLRTRPAAGLAFCSTLCGAKGKGMAIWELKTLIMDCDITAAIPYELLSDPYFAISLQSCMSPLQIIARQPSRHHDFIRGLCGTCHWN